MRNTYLSRSLVWCFRCQGYLHIFTQGSAHEVFPPYFPAPATSSYPLQKTHVFHVKPKTCSPLIIGSSFVPQKGHGVAGGLNTMEVGTQWKFLCVYLPLACSGEWLGTRVTMITFG